MAVKQGLDRKVAKRELDAAPVARMPEVLDPARRQRVRKALSELAQAVGEPRMALSLYHALGLELTEDGGLVKERYERARSENGQRAIGTTATLYKSVLAEAKLLLVDADPRAYVEGLVLDVKDEMEFDGAEAAASGGVIDAIEAEQLLRRAIELGLTPDLARRVVVELAKDNGVAIEIGATTLRSQAPQTGPPRRAEVDTSPSGITAEGMRALSSHADTTKRQISVPGGQGDRRQYSVFISYRREEASAVAGRLFDWLDRHFGANQIFMDLDLEPGIDFADEIEHAVGSCRVLLAVIGPRWSTVVDASGEPRLHDPDDLLRLEIEVALRRPDVRVIPVLVQGSLMPKRQDLPDTLALLLRRNAVSLSNGAWQRDVERLITAIARILER